MAHGELARTIHECYQQLSHRWTTSINNVRNFHYNLEWFWIKSNREAGEEIRGRMPQVLSTAAPVLTPRFCFDERLLRDFLRLSRSTIDDSITQNLNALITPAQEGFDPSSTAVRRAEFRPQINPADCQSFKDNVLFPSWQTRSDVLTYCTGVATSPDPDDPDLILRQTESARDREREVDERLDPYSARFFPREARTESLANLIRNERTIEEIVRARTWGMVSEKCSVSSVSSTWEEALNSWRHSHQK
ncbi:hypothetical protein N7463_007088 [Penicillium fimorum]|uniref:Caffeine-induced death protein 2 n=1 Tax=Penicillium fimorum TaxID=1882269 RepID=A0A9X0C6N9_9EURO|nr:hypothetical protein N7463_007088 [Penicillium fimorum]